MMSICALMVVGVLSGVLGNVGLVDDATELRSILRGFCELADQLERSGSEASVSWDVPFMSSGGTITLSISSGVVRGVCAGESAVCEPRAPLHLWRYDGYALNRTLVEELAGSEPSLTTASGHVLEIRTEYVIFENQAALFVFVFAVR